MKKGVEVVPMRTLQVSFLSFPHLSSKTRVALTYLSTILPEDPWRYFLRTPNSKLVPVSSLVTIRARESGILHAREHMVRAYHGLGDRRKPISLRDNGNGTYTVVDGNSTVANAKENNWKMIPGEVES